MNTIIDIVNQSKHPIDSYEYIQYCNDEIKKNSILILNDFLTNDCLSELITEAHGLQNQAFYCSQNHTILLNKQDKLSDLNDPLNIEVVSDKGCVPHDLLNQQSKLIIGDKFSTIYAKKSIEDQLSFQNHIWKNTN